VCITNSAGSLPGAEWWKRLSCKQPEVGGDLWGGTCVCLHFLSSLSICFWMLTETGTGKRELRKGAEAGSSGTAVVVKNHTAA